MKQVKQMAEKWGEKFLSSDYIAYLELARVKNPIGFYLLLAPSLWGVALAQKGFEFVLWIVFILGAFLMRAAGCAYNDFVDRGLDKKVRRTKVRPLASGKLTPLQGIIFIIVLLLVAFLLLLTLNSTTILLGFIALGLVLTYPWMKRITYWPQAFLGLTMNWGLLMGWTAVYEGFFWTPLIFYVGAFFWTLGYDTIYAHQDTIDDVLIGVKSSALALEDKTKPFLIFVYLNAFLCFLLGGHVENLGTIYFATLLFIGGHFGWQIRTLDIERPENCLMLFKSNKWIGFVLLCAIVIDKFIGI